MSSLEVLTIPVCIIPITLNNYMYYKNKQHKKDLLFAFSSNTALDVSFCKKSRAYNVLFETVELCGIVLLILRIFWELYFSFVKNLNSCCIFFVFIHSVSPVTFKLLHLRSQTFRTRSFLSNFGRKSISSQLFKTDS